MARRGTQLDLPIRTWGGRRAGAGRKPAPGRPRVPHRRRAPHDRHCPAHVTLRAAATVPSLRTDPIFFVVQKAFRAASGERFRLLHFSVQADHVHLVVEADGTTAFERGIRGLAVRVAKAVNRALGRRGAVWGDRYHARLLRTPREVRNALVYVLNNWRKHISAARGVDARSSARWFDGWRTAVERPSGPAPVAAPARGSRAAAGGGTGSSTKGRCHECPSRVVREPGVPLGPSSSRDLAGTAASRRPPIECPPEDGIAQLRTRPSVADPLYGHALGAIPAR